MRFCHRFHQKFINKWNSCIQGEYHYNHGYFDIWYYISKNKKSYNMSRFADLSFILFITTVENYHLVPLTSTPQKFFPLLTFSA